MQVFSHVFNPTFKNKKKHQNFKKTNKTLESILNSFQSVVNQYKIDIKLIDLAEENVSAEDAPFLKLVNL